MGFLDDVGDFLFGSGGQTDIRTLPVISGQQEESLNFLLQLLQESIQGEGISGQSGDLLSELLALRDQSRAQGLLGGVGEAQNAVSGLLKGGPTFDVDQTFKDLVQDPLLRNFEEDIIPQIRRRFAPEFTGGERQLAESRATEDLLQQLVGARAGLAKDFTQQQQSAITSGLQLGGVPASIESLVARSQSEFLGAAGAEQDRKLRMLQLLLGGATSPTIENVAGNREGTSGVGPEALAGIAGAVGALFCWIARAAYQDTRWLEFRQRIVEKASLEFIINYCIHGPWLAELVKRSPTLRKALVPALDKMWR
jgi:hypothetical protein